MVAIRLGPGTKGEAAVGGSPLARFAAVWRSGPLTFIAPPRLTQEQARTTVASWETSLIGALETFEGFVLDPHRSAVRAENKPFQLHLAQAMGLDLPRTVITNDPAEVLAFAKRAELVLKLLVPQSLLRKGDAGAEIPVLWTQPLAEADLADLTGLRTCPMIFQERIAKARDVRVTFVGDRLFPVSVDPNLVDEPHVDWRQDGLALRGHWRPHALPGDVARKLEAMRIELGLNYGAFDLIETPEGRHVFLEVNSFGVFSFIGEGLAAPIAEAIAGILLSPPAGANHG